MTRGPVPDPSRQRLVDSIENLVHRLNSLRTTRKTVLVGVDGGGGSGKSFFAAALRAYDPTIHIVSIDDFFLPSSRRQGESSRLWYDWDRLREQVLDPLARDESAHYQRYDWQLDELAEWHSVPVGGINVIEGIFATQPQLATYYDFKVWVHYPRDGRLERGVQRDGEEKRSIWTDFWMPSDDEYLRHFSPDKAADLVVLGASPDHVDWQKRFTRLTGSDFP